MAKILIPKQVTFDLPEGNYRAKLVKCVQQLKQTSRGSQSFIRPVFEVTIPGMENVYALAGRKFEEKMDPGTDLRNFLESWLGRDFFLGLSGKELDFDTLEGKWCELTLRHFQGKKFEKPLVIIESLFPLGTLKLTDNKTAATKVTAKD